MSLSDDLRRHAGPVWDRIFSHPFVTGLGDGTLPLESFKFYLVQDYRFLIDYSRVLAVASAKAPDLEGMTRFAGLLHATLAEEMDLHRRYCARVRHQPCRTGASRDRAGHGGLYQLPSLRRLSGDGDGDRRSAAPLPMGLLRNRP